MITEIKTWAVQCSTCDHTEVVQSPTRMGALDQLTGDWEIASDRELWCPTCVAKEDESNG